MLFERQLESTWILFNKAKSETLTNEHAGFLMGQGLNGHLAKLATLNVHDYLIKVCVCQPGLSYLCLLDLQFLSLSAMLFDSGVLYDAVNSLPHTAMILKPIDIVWIVVSG